MALSSVTIPISPALAQRLQPFQDRLPEILERGVELMDAEKGNGDREEDAILNVLVSNPAPAQVLALRPSSRLQARTSELLVRSKRGDLSRQEERELDRYLMLEHLVRLAKAHAAQRLVQHP